MSADEQGKLGKVSGRAARKYTGPASNGAPAGFMRVRTTLEALIGALATSFATGLVTMPRASQSHRGVSVMDAILYIHGTTRLDKQGREIALGLGRLDEAKAFLRTTRVSGQVSAASGSMMGTLRKCLEVVEAARPSSELRQEKAASKQLASRKAKRREARRATENTLAHLHESSSSSEDGDDEGGGQARQKVCGHANDEHWGVCFGNRGH